MDPQRLGRLVPAVLGLAGVVGTVALQAHEQTGTDPAGRAVAYGLVGVVGLALAPWRAYAGWALVLAGMVAYTLDGYPGGPIYLCLPVALFVVGLAKRWPTTVALAVVDVVVMTGATATTRGGDAVLGEGAGITAWAVIAVLASQLARGRRQRLAEQRQRQADEARRARVEERVRIARDLHDGVAHALSVISIQASVARSDVAHGSSAAGALDIIASTTRTALADVGLVLEGLRDGEVPLTPQSTLAELEVMVEAARAAGQDVVCEQHVTAPVPAAVQSAVVRIVQESLTNARKHAHASSVRMQLTDADALRLEVVNELAGGAGEHGHDGLGLGLIGMRERAASTGGTLEAGSHGTQWKVVARWPR